jgi:hypothetical protein
VTIRSAVIAIGAVLALLAWPHDAGACSCVLRSPCQKFAGAAAVFVGEVLEVVEGPRTKDADVRVEHVYKGSPQTGATVRVRMPPGDSGRCSLDVSRGRRYVIYAEESAGFFATGLCHGSYRLRAGAARPDLPPPGGQVTGRLERIREWPPASTPIEGARVWVMTPDGPIESRTDAEGRFRLTGVPPGRRQVYFDAGRGETAEAPIELQSADDCAEISASTVRPGL